MEDRSQTIISCHDLCYTVQVKRKGKCCSTEEKVILQNINGLFKPGINAILGATGSGKTSLLDTLAGRKDPKGVSGHVLVNGAPQPKNFKCMTGYVVQEDVVMGTLTVRENLMFSANMRLSADTPRADKQRLVDATIRELGLRRCADTKVGNQFIRGISGGEKKRTNIGMELIVSPSLLFLDEPTSGLDSNTANAVLRLLSRISKRGRTIIFSIHQPRYSIYKLFDQLFLLSRGRTVYHGPMTEALDYFSQQGYVCEEHNNPPDFFLDVINGDPEVRRRNALSPKKEENAKDADGSFKNRAFSAVSGSQIDVEGAAEEDEEDEMSEEFEENDELADYYLQSQCCERVRAELAPIYKEFEKDSNCKEQMRGEYANTFGTQLKFLSKRTIVNILRNPATTVLQISVFVILALISGILFLDQDRKLPEALQNRNGFFFFCVMNMAFSNMGAIELFIKERLIYLHEHSNGFYRTSAYFVSKICFDFIPLRVVPVIFYAAITYFMIGLRLDAGSFFFFTLVLILTSIVAASISFSIGASVGIYAVAHIVTALTYVMSMIFGGFLLNLDSIWVGLRWLQYLSLFRYSINALAINEYKNFDFKFKNTTSNKWVDVQEGENYLDEQGVDYETDWHKWQNVLALALLSLGALVLAYIQLRRINKYR